MDLPLSWNADFIDTQYRLWKTDPHGVSPEWRVFFQGFELAAFPEREPLGVCDKSQVVRQSHVEELIYRYRDLGHLLACLDPLASCPTEHPLLALEAFKLTQEDLDRVFFTPHFHHSGQMPLREIVRALKETYCRSIGVEYMHLQDPAERKWLQERMEPVRNRMSLEKEARLRILKKLCQASLFDQFLHSRYIGQKRFSIEGAEVVVPMLDFLFSEAAGVGCREIILGMAHRGRLSVQTNVLEKPYSAVFCEFEDNYDPDSVVGGGDVKYHKGFLAEIETFNHRKVRVLLSSNPSHLESVDPVVEGIARARQEEPGRIDPGFALPVLIHGDAAFSGQGIVFETLNLSQLEGYRTGGTVHIVINNQIGFTTLPEDARSTRYSTDVAKMLMVPIFHVHGESPEAAMHVAKLAVDYRFEFGKDVVIDLVCYRRYGHNEGDEPYYTQPQMYDRIKERPPVYRVYAEMLASEGVIAADEVGAIQADVDRCLVAEYENMHGRECSAPGPMLMGGWEGIHGVSSPAPVETGVADGVLVSLARKAAALPPSFSIHPKLDRILKRRLEAVEKGEGIDWAGAEALAFASLLVDGTPVRLSGQDSRRGTFSQRHSVLVDPATGEHFTPLNGLSEDQATFSVYDSMLSEGGVLGFEYGYSLVSPRSLVIWEAQFGDFANNAQVIIDQYISSAQSKWQALSGLVLLLPHAYEGQGAEHSSARLERFLQLCAEENLQVCNPTTPAQYFHLLRRQMKRSFRKPLIVMAPKSLLRHPLAVSGLSDLSSGHFREVLDDPAAIGAPSRVLFCSGKVYYDLLERREALGAQDIAILRLEQLYPFPEAQIREMASKYAAASRWLWVQEEPRNMGGWTFVRPLMGPLISGGIDYVGRAASASPATGYRQVFTQERQAILDEAVGAGR